MPGKSRVEYPWFVELVWGQFESVMAREFKRLHWKQADGSGLSWAK